MGLKPGMWLVGFSAAQRQDRMRVPPHTSSDTDPYGTSMHSADVSTSSYTWRGVAAHKHRCVFHVRHFTVAWAGWAWERHD